MKSKLLLLILIFISKLTFSQCEINYNNFHIVFEDDFNTYENVQNIFEYDQINNTYPKWTSDYYHGSTVKSVEIECTENQSPYPIKRQTYLLLLRDNIGLIQDPYEANDKCVTLGYNVHNNGIKNPYNNNDNNLYYKSSAVLRGKYNDNDGDCNFKQGFKYGMYEIRCKIPMQVGYQSAFWFWSGLYDTSCYTNDIGCEPGWEVDVFEAMNNDYSNIIACNTSVSDYNYHYKQWMVSAIQPNFSAKLDHNDCKICLNSYDLINSRFSDEFHTYTFVWLPGKMTIFIDGKEVRTDYNTAKRGVPNIEMDLLISTYLQWLPRFDIRNGTPTTAGFNQNMQYDLNKCYCDGPTERNFDVPYDPLIVDYVRVYKPNFDYNEPEIDNYKSNINKGNTINKISTSNYLNEKNLLKFNKNNGDEFIFYVEYFSDIRNKLSKYIFDGNTFNKISTNSPFLSKSCNISSKSSNEILFSTINNEIGIYYVSSNTYSIISSNVGVLDNLIYSNLLNRIYFRNINQEICYLELISTNWNLINTNIICDKSMTLNTNQNNNEVVFYTFSNSLKYLDFNNNDYLLDNVYYNQNSQSDIKYYNNKLYFTNNFNELCYLKKINNNWIYYITDKINNVYSKFDMISDDRLTFISNKNNKYSFEESVYNKDGRQWMTTSYNHFSEDININDYLILNNNNLILVKDDNNLYYVKNELCEITNPECLTKYEIDNCLKFTNINFKNQINENTINNEDKKMYATYFPNKFNDYIEIKSNLYSLNIYLYNNLGQKLYESSISSNENIKINTTQFPSGSYILNFLYEDGKIDSDVIIK